MNQISNFNPCELFERLDSEGKGFLTSNDILKILKYPFFNPSLHDMLVTREEVEIFFSSILRKKTKSIKFELFVSLTLAQSQIEDINRTGDMRGSYDTKRNKMKIKSIFSKILAKDIKLLCLLSKL